MYDYFIAWRKAYHGARVVYHQEMARFYENQAHVLETFLQLYIDSWKAMTQMGMLKQLTESTKWWSK